MKFMELQSQGYNFSACQQMLKTWKAIRLDTDRSAISQNLESKLHSAVHTDEDGRIGSKRCSKRLGYVRFCYDILLNHHQTFQQTEMLLSVTSRPPFFEIITGRPTDQHTVMRGHWEVSFNNLCILYLKTRSNEI